MSLNVWIDLRKRTKISTRKSEDSENGYTWASNSKGGSDPQIVGESGPLPWNNQSMDVQRTWGSASHVAPSSHAGGRALVPPCGEVRQPLTSRLLDRKPEVQQNGIVDADLLTTDRSELSIVQSHIDALTPGPPQYLSVVLHWTQNYKVTHAWVPRIPSDCTPFHLLLSQRCRDSAWSNLETRPIGDRCSLAPIGVTAS